MPQAEGLSIKFDSHDRIQAELLETLPYEGEEQLIEMDYPEFSAVCPFSGLPDIALVTIRYIPTDKIVELKSLKYYFISYRNVGIYQEDMTNKVYRDLKKLLEPKALEVQTIYNIRGGIETTCTIGKIINFDKTS
ncbi:MAG: NADPH-dependent 7-cyano-7-deazaguanine reductase QueF [Candidatus Marinimicrobia bacterium]|nr:NADPH-dependent 7-cyano-7-deazaguanine reductase QueF [Candidatus Neomarinimicrobiota bacterium]